MPQYGIENGMLRNDAITVLGASCSGSQPPYYICGGIGKQIKWTIPSNHLKEDFLSNLCLNLKK